MFKSLNNPLISILKTYIKNPDFSTVTKELNELLTQGSIFEMRTK